MVPLSVNINTLPVNFQVEWIELQSHVQFKEKFDHISLADFYKLSLTKEKYRFTVTSHSCNHFLVVGTFVNNYFQEA